MAGKEQRNKKIAHEGRREERGETMKRMAIVDITKQRREKIFDNLLELHTRICEESISLRACDVLDFSEALLGMLKKQGANLKCVPIEEIECAEPHVMKGVFIQRGRWLDE